MSKAETVFKLKYKKMVSLTGSIEQVGSYLEMFRIMKSSRFTYDKVRSRNYAIYSNIAPDRLVCLRTKGRQLAKAHVVLLECGTQICISSITNNNHSLDCDTYNQIVDAFVQDYLNGDIRKNLHVDIYEEYEPLNTVMGVEAAEALQAWEYSCCIDEGNKVTCDEHLWQKAVLAINHEEAPVDGAFLRNWLQKGNNWKEESYPAIEHYAYLLDYSNSLLTEYQKKFDEKYSELEDLYENCELEVEHNPFFSSLIHNRITLKDIREMMASKLFIPQNEYELDKIADYYQQWIDFANYEKTRGFVSKAIEICTTVLDEIGRRFESDEYYACYDDLCPLENTCLEVAAVLAEIMRSSDTEEGMKSRILRNLTQVAKHSSFVDYRYFDIEEFISKQLVPF